MKKIISVFLLAAMIVSMFTFVANAIDTGDNFGTVPIAKGIKIDGVKDAVYANGLKVLCNTDITLTTDSTAVAYLVWSEGFLYVYAEVTDTQMVAIDTTAQTTSPWTVDSLEVFLQPKNDGIVVEQYRLDPTSYKSHQVQTNKVAGINVKGADSDKYFEGKAGTFAGGYAVEFKLPLTGAPAAGAKIGFQIQMNDIRNDKTRAVRVSPAKLLPGSWDGAKYNYITLGSNDITPTTAAATTAATTKAPAATTAGAAKTGDNSVVIVMMLMLALGMAVTVFKTGKSAK